MKDCSEGGPLSDEKRCYGKALWLRYYEKEETFGKTEKVKEKNETVLKGKSSEWSVCKSVEKIKDYSYYKAV